MIKWEFTGEVNRVGKERMYRYEIHFSGKNVIGYTRARTKKIATKNIKTLCNGMEERGLCAVSRKNYNQIKGD